MKVYQLRLTDLNLLLEPVFESKESAMLFMSKYHNRQVNIEENIISIPKNNYVYRILKNDEEGYELLDNIFADIEETKKYLETVSLDNCQIVKESLLSNKNFDYQLIEV